MRKQIASVVLCAACLLGLAACAEKAALAGLALPDAPLVLAVGQSAAVALAPRFSTEAPSEEEKAAALEAAALVWASSDEAVATVENGVVTAVAAGKAEVSVADATGQHTAVVAVAVLAPVESAAVPGALTLDLLAGETAVLAVDVRPANATNVEIAYQSGDESVVTVDGAGVLTPVAEGEAVVTATVAGDSPAGRTQQVLATKVQVKLLPQGIALESAEGLLYVGHSHQLHPYTMPGEAPPSTYSYASSDPAVATVDATGALYAVGAGTCVVTVTSAEGHTAAYALTVTTAPRSTGGGTGATGGTGTAGGGGTAGTGGSGGGSDAGGGNTGGTSGGAADTGNTGGGEAAPPDNGSDSGGGDSGLPPYGTPGNPAGGAHGPPNPDAPEGGGF